MAVAETTVTVVIGSEVSAQVLPNASNTVATVTQAIAEPTLWEQIINLIKAMFL